MIKVCIGKIFAGVFLFLLALSINGQKKGVEVRRNDKDRCVDLLIDGEPFTSDIWPENLKKPVLFPVRTANGTVVTRRYPVEPRGGESVDHPHQAGARPKSILDRKKESPVRELKFTLEPRRSVTFRYRVLVLSKKAGDEDIARECQSFSGTD